LMFGFVMFSLLQKPGIFVFVLRVNRDGFGLFGFLVSHD